MQPATFHTATVLPDQQILIAGGAVGMPGTDPDSLDAATHLFLTSSYEIYDPWQPAGSEVQEVVFDGPAPKPRAFHHAVVRSVSSTVRKSEIPPS